MRYSKIYLQGVMDREVAEKKILVGPLFCNNDVIHSYDVIVTPILQKYWWGLGPTAPPPTTSLVSRALWEEMTVKDDNMLQIYSILWKPLESHSYCKHFHGEI